MTEYLIIGGKEFKWSGGYEVEKGKLVGFFRRFSDFKLARGILKDIKKT